VKVAVVGAGVTGLTAAYRLAQSGCACDVYERWAGLGGQVATREIPGGDRLEHYYHHLFTTDEAIVELYEELGMPDAVEWLPSSVAVLADGRQLPFTSPLDLLRFRPLSVRGRVRLGAGVLALQRRARDVAPFERLTAREMVVRWLGREAWDVLWGPLLRGKFGARADEISAAWLWSKLTLRRRIEGESARRELLGYPRGGWQPLLDGLAEQIEAAGGRVLTDRPARRVSRDGARFAVEAGAPGSFRTGRDPAAFESAGRASYDAVVATVPSEVFLALLDGEVRRELGNDYAARVAAAEYQAALCLVLELDRPFSPFYWTNVADPRLPFIGLIEHTNLVPPERYGGRRFLYVANYVERDDPLLGLGADELLDRYLDGLREVRPDFDRGWVRDLRVYREPDAQPVVTPGYRDRMPALRTPVAGLVLANTTQIYPEDRGTNYSVRLGGQAAATLLDGSGRAV
jgi:protoporphyrinogen oxidase